MFLTASVGILSADCAACGVTCFLGLYHALMVLLLLLQVSVVCFYFFDKTWEEDLPPDSTGDSSTNYILRSPTSHNAANRVCLPSRTGSPRAFGRWPVPCSTDHNINSTCP